MLETGFPNDWLDQTMSYQLIQTTSFAMHPRLVKYNAEALVWMYCIFLLVILSQRASADLAFLLVLCKSKTPSFLLNQALSFCNPNLAKHAIHQVLVPAGHCHRKILLLILIANAKRCRSNLFKRHRFAIANFTYHLLNLCLCASAESIPLYPSAEL
ncbi:methyltransferase-like protein 13-like [Dorcoceras hygrometricum]|uniref:Methyltransferase-like protein 13-like n=1 Tax=Dorcoceras hygrometricum TaxID=472368 RepID=A0A2Z7CCF0_9LAMI|nr:methyltransferase-like protein 13-like [Dorcoceras hygrometricum]